MAMAEKRTQQVMQAYFDALLTHGDFARYFRDDVVATFEGTDARYQGREAVRQLIEGAHAFGEIKLLRHFASDAHAALEADFIRNDGRHVPYAVIYDLADDTITALHFYFTGPIQP